MKYTYGLSDKVIAYLTLFSGLTISAVAIYYSVAGLVAIFSAAVIPIIVMGVALEISKLAATVWLKQNWNHAPNFIRGYLLAAIAILMLITSMGIFGFLSKAHSDQSLVSGDVISKIAVYDEKIKTAKDNIDANRKALKQLDEAVDQVMARSQDEKGADKAVALRRGQAKERTRLLSEITAEQKVIAQLNEERAPIAAEVRKVEAEVGPIKYIAAFIYGDNPDANVLEKAVTWVIIIIVLVFDPLAVILLLASQYSFQWFRDQKDKVSLEEKELVEEPEPIDTGYVPGPWPFPVKEKEDDFKFLADEKDLYPEGKTWEDEPKIELPETVESEKSLDEEAASEEEAIIESAAETEKAAMRLWKSENPENSVKHQRMLLDRGAIKKLPWDNYLKAKPDFDDDAEEEAVKWALEQKEKRDALKFQVSEVDRPGDYLTESDSKKKDNTLDGEGRESADNQDQGRIEGYVQNAEQNADTIWNRIKKG